MPFTVYLNVDQHIIILNVSFCAEFYPLFKLLLKVIYISVVRLLQWI